MAESSLESSETTSQNRASKFQCPADFETITSDSAASALWDGSGWKELWLIKAPARFDPKCFANLKLPLSGLEMVQSLGASPQIYSVLSGSVAPSDLRLLVSKHSSQDHSLCSSGFSGVLKISETYGDHVENQGLKPIPATPAPQIPDGLKQRFQPFGSSVTVVSSGVPNETRKELSDGEERKKKKKKKKDKRREDAEEAFVKQEVKEVECDELERPEHALTEEPAEERRRKKKKMKRERNSKDEELVNASLIYKEERMDTHYGDIEIPIKSKKKKKKSSRGE